MKRSPIFRMMLQKKRWYYETVIEIMSNYIIGHYGSQIYKLLKLFCICWCYLLKAHTEIFHFKAYFRLFCNTRLSYQIDWVRKAVLEAVVLQELSQVRDVARGESKRVQFGQLGVCWYPGQAGLQPGECFAQHSHPRPLPGVGRVSLRLARFLLVRLGESALVADPLLHAVIFQLLVGVAAGMVAGSPPRGGSPPVTHLVVLSITCSRASGHGCSTCASEADTRGTSVTAVAANLDSKLGSFFWKRHQMGSQQTPTTTHLVALQLLSPWNVTTWQSCSSNCLRSRL